MPAFAEAELQPSEKMSSQKRQNIRGAESGGLLKILFAELEWRSGSLGSLSVHLNWMAAGLTGMRACLTAVLLVITAEAVMAGSLEEAKAAYDQGDFRRAERIYSELSNQGDRIAQLQLGLMYDEGHAIRNRISKPCDGFLWPRAKVILKHLFISAESTRTVEAGVPQALPKADRLDIHPVGRDCSQQAWPNFEASCLRVAGTKATNIREARSQTARSKVSPSGSVFRDYRVSI
jgi:hypothetical protein